MHDSEGKQLNAEIDFCGVILNLLSEWKAILLVSIVTAIVFSGIKFNVDKKEYDAKVEKIKQIEENMTENEEKEVLNTFSSIDRAPIELLLSQQEWVKAQKEYLDNSILFNSDPTNQRTLFIPVLIYDCEDASMPAVYKSYSFLVNDEKFLKIIGKEIDRDSDLRFIK